MEPSDEPGPDPKAAGSNPAGPPAPGHQAAASASAAEPGRPAQPVRPAPAVLSLAKRREDIMAPRTQLSARGEQMDTRAGAIEAIAAAASPAGGMELLGGDALPRPGPRPGRDPWLVVRRFLAAGAVLRRPDAFHAAVAVGPLQVDIARLEASAAPRCTIAAQSRVRCVRYVKCLRAAASPSSNSPVATKPKFVYRDRAPRFCGS